jgi:hypothetical protein
VTEQCAVGGSQYNVGATLKRYSGGCAQLDDSVHLLEGVREEEVKERLVCAIAHATHLLNEMRHTHRRGLEVWRKDEVEVVSI